MLDGLPAPCHSGGVRRVGKKSEPRGKPKAPEPPEPVQLEQDDWDSKFANVPKDKFIAFVDALNELEKPKEPGKP
jgi:hypothetical protein